MQPPSSDLEKKKQETRTHALLGLAASQPQQVDECPDEETLGAFIEGTLDPEQRMIMLAHFDGCSHCYETWLTISSLGEKQKPAEVIQGPWSDECLDEEILTAFIAGTLDPEQSKEILAHLDVCSQCDNRWMTLSPMQEQQVCASAAPVPFRKRPRGQNIWFSKAAISAFAAAACLVLFIGVRLLQVPPVQVPSYPVPDSSSTVTSTKSSPPLSLEPDSEEIEYGFTSQKQSKERSIVERQSETRSRRIAEKPQSYQHLSFSTWLDSLIRDCGQGQKEIAISPETRSRHSYFLEYWSRQEGDFAQSAVQLLRYLQPMIDTSDATINCTEFVKPVEEFLKKLVATPQ